MISGVWLERLLEFVPDARGFAVGVSAGVITAFMARSAAVMGMRRGWRTGDTRKIFHVTVFSSAAILRWFTGMGALAVFGVIVAGTVLNGVRLRGSSPLFRALARPEDKPHEAWYVVIPLCATAFGGGVSHLLGGRLSAVSLLVSAWGDAVGEPVGVRWGRHRYRIPALSGLTCTRSWEGSLAVFAASFLAAATGLMLLGIRGDHFWGTVALVGLAGTLVETVSPHGWDNFTVPMAVVMTLMLLGFR